MQHSFDDKMVLVTGGNSGIGQATAQAFAQAGATVLVTGRRPQALEETIKLHSNIHGVAADVQKEADAQAAVAKAIEIKGRLDVLVNNAGVFAMAPLEAVTAEQMLDLFATNVFGVTHVSKAALPHLKQSRGVIINISSAAGHTPAPQMSHYAASKAAVESLTRSWALELAPTGVRVNSVAPGPVDTPIFGKGGLSPEGIDQAKKQMTAMVPLGRMGNAAEIAAWVLSLADPDVAWVTGQVLSVDGGMSLT